MNLPKIRVVLWEQDGLGTHASVDGTFLVPVPAKEGVRVHRHIQDPHQLPLVVDAQGFEVFCS